MENINNQDIVEIGETKKGRDNIALCTSINPCDDDTQNSQNCQISPNKVETEKTFSDQEYLDTLLPNLDRLENLPNDFKKYRFCLANSYEKSQYKKAPFKCEIWNGRVKSAYNNKPETFSDFDTALESLQRNPYYYDYDAKKNIENTFVTIGVLNHDGLCFLDFDHVVKDGKIIDETVKRILKDFNTYCEYSYSGDGIHVYFTCKEYTEILKQNGFDPNPGPGRDKKQKFFSDKHPFKDSDIQYECYLSQLTNHYAIVTGNRIKEYPNKINDVDRSTIRDLMHEFFIKENALNPKKQEIKNSEPNLESQYRAGLLTDDEIVKRLESLPHDSKAYKLFVARDVSCKDNDWHRADYALINILIFYTQNNPAQIKRLMWRSSIVRDGSREAEGTEHPDKWVKETKYLDYSINKACKSYQGIYYDPQYFAKKDIETLKKEADICEKIIEENQPPKKDNQSDTKAQKGGDNSIPPLDLQSAAEIEEEKMNWLWYPYIAKGCICVICARPGVGKSFIGLWLAAHVTGGESFPINDEKNDHGNGVVVYLSAEDSYPKTIVPRLNKYDGDPKKFLFPRIRKKDEKGNYINTMPSSFNDPRIDEILEKYDPELIIFDGLSSFTGKANINAGPEVRELLDPLAAKIEERDTAIVIIHHDNKMSSVTDAMDRVAGSRQITAQIRTGLTVGKNPADKNQIILAQFKSNIGIVGDSVAFEWQDAGDETIPHMKYIGESKITPNELFGEKLKKGAKSRLATQLIEELLNEAENNNERLWTDSVNSKLKASGISDSTIKRVKKDMDFKSKFDSEKNRYFWEKAEDTKK